MVDPEEFPSPRDSRNPFLKQHCEFERHNAKELLWSTSWSLLPNRLLQSLLNLLISTCIYCGNERDKINEQNSVHTPENSRHHFSWRLHSLELLFDCRVGNFPHHRFNLALWSAVKGQSLRILYHALCNAK
jgi:hypothetical protein